MIDKKALKAAAKKLKEWNLGGEGEIIAMSIVKAYLDALGKEPEATYILRPSLPLLVKLGSIAVHVEEMLSEDGHAFDRIALTGLLQEAEVADWLKVMRKHALVPVKRKG